VIDDCELAIWLTSSVATQSLIDSGKIEQHLEAWGRFIPERTQHYVYTLPLNPHRRHAVASSLFSHYEIAMHLAQLH
jgi:hypothetical protein